MPCDPENWLDRLINVVEASGRSMRDISLSAGFGHAYLREVIELGKEPRLGSLMAICAELEVHPSYILTGIDLSPEAEEVARLMARLPLSKQEEFARFVKRYAKTSDTALSEHLAVPHG